MRRKEYDIKIVVYQGAKHSHQQPRFRLERVEGLHLKHDIHKLVIPVIRCLSQRCMS